MSDLHAAAAAARLARDWEDADGRTRRVSDTVLDAVLARLDTTPPSRPFVVAVAGEPIALPPGLPGGAVALVGEDGREGPVARAPDGTLSPVHVIGYHRLAIGGTEVDLAVAPARCPAAPPGQGWAAAVQIPALRGDTARAFGDAGALTDAALAFGAAGADALAISPTHALFPADPTRYSPYAPSSRLFHNVLLADPALVGGHLPPEPGPDLIDWHGAIPHRLQALRAVFDTLDDPRRAAMQAYRNDRGPALEAHARFDALHGLFHARDGARGWQDWPSGYHDPNGSPVARFAAERPDEVAFFVFLQWLAELGLAAAQGAARARMRIGLVADLAIGMDAGGSHGWSRRDELLTGLTVGAPPDPLGPDGQNWGIAALDPFALRRTGFAPWAETLRVALAHAGGIRIDHALGLKRLWVVPEGAAADQGVYLSIPFAEMLAVLRIEAHRAGALVIGEDLGTVPHGFRDTLAAQGLLGMRVLPFERDRAGGFTDPAGWDADAVAMTGTHDTPTLAGWWRGRDIEWNRALGRGSPGSQADEIRAAERDSLWQVTGGDGPVPGAPPIDRVLAHVAAAPGPLAIVPFEDLVGLKEQPNLPGTVDEHPNWRRRLPAATDALLAEPAVAARTALLSRLRPGQDPR